MQSTLVSALCLQRLPKAVAGTPSGIVCVDLPANGADGAKLEAGAKTLATVSAVYTKLQVSHLGHHSPQPARLLLYCATADSPSGRQPQANACSLRSSLLHTCCCLPPGVAPGRNKASATGCERKHQCFMSTCPGAVPEDGDAGGPATSAVQGQPVRAVPPPNRQPGRQGEFVANLWMVLSS